MTDRFVCVACGAEQERATIRCERCGKPLVFAERGFNGRYILDGRTPKPELSLLRWERWMEAADRTVKYTEQGDVHVSTVFLGLNYDMGGEGPKLFQTMVFVAGAGGDCRRYATWDQAEKGHDEIVRKIFAARSRVGSCGQ